MTEKEQLFIDDLRKLYDNFPEIHCNHSHRVMMSVSEIEDFANIWKKYFLQSFKKIFTDSSFFTKYSDLFAQYGITYNSDIKNPTILSYTYCDNGNVDFEKHGYVFLRNADNCRIYDYVNFSAENCLNLKCFGNTKGKVTGSKSTVITKGNVRIEAIDIECAEISEYTYLKITKVRKVVAHGNSVVNIVSVHDEETLVELNENSVIIAPPDILNNERLKIIRK